METAWDIANVAMGVVSMAQNINDGNYGAATVDAVGVAFDVAAVVLPGVPAGAGATIKAVKAANKAADVAQAARKTDKVGDTLQASKQAGGAAGKGCSSFVAGTQVLTLDGGVPIEELKPGDWVIGFDHDRAARSYLFEELGLQVDDFVWVYSEDGSYQTRVSQLAVGERFLVDAEVFELRHRGVARAVATGLVVRPIVDTFGRVADGVFAAQVASQTTEELIFGTEEHPFYVPKDGLYQPLKELGSSTRLRASSSAGAVLISKTWVLGDVPVFNFEVEDVHNYFVAEAGVFSLVHNADCDLTKGALGNAVEMGPGMRSHPALDMPGGPKSGSAGGPTAGMDAPETIRDQAQMEAGGRCVFCGEGTTVERGRLQGQADHSIPKSLDGNATIENIQWTCAGCNNAKRVQTTEEFLGQ